LIPAEPVRVNGEPHTTEGWGGRRLIDFLRSGLGLTGAKEGCGEGECGACTVLLDGEPVCSCLLIVAVARGRDVTTVEGLDPSLRERVLAGIEAEGGVQCGFCTPGFAVMAQWFAMTRPQGDAIPKQLEGNLCRCTGYV
jgi:carbon-monoxide dehydrogenase small subunit